MQSPNHDGDDHSDNRIIIMAHGFTLLSYGFILFFFIFFTLYTHRYYYTVVDDATFNLLYAARGALNPKVSPSRAKSRSNSGAKTNNTHT